MNQVARRSSGAGADKRLREGLVPQDSESLAPSHAHAVNHRSRPASLQITRATHGEDDVDQLSYSAPATPSYGRGAVSRDLPTTAELQLPFYPPSSTVLSSSRLRHHSADMSSVMFANRQDAHSDQATDATRYGPSLHGLDLNKTDLALTRSAADTGSADPKINDNTLMEYISSRPQSLAKRPNQEQGLPQKNNPARLIRLLDKILLLRTQWVNEHNVYIHCHEILSESVKALESTMEQDPVVGSITFVNDPIQMFRNYKHDLEALNLQQAKLIDIQDELSNLEYRLQRKERRLFDIFKGLHIEYSIAPSLGATGTLHSSENTTGSHEATEIDPLLNAYYEWKGEVGVLRDRLAEIDTYYVDGLANREVLRDRGDELEQSDEQFENGYARQRYGTLADLAAAEAECARLARECELAGLSLDDPRASSTSDADYKDTSSDISNSDYHTPSLPDAYGTMYGGNMSNWLRVLEPTAGILQPEIFPSIGPSRIGSPKPTPSEKDEEIHPRRFHSGDAGIQSRLPKTTNWNNRRRSRSFPG